ncbi:hypothetical protein [Spirosoma arcticum]
MQRLSTTVLSMALTVFVTAISLALIAAAWLMTSQFLNGSTRPLLPKWLLIGLLMAGIGQATAQPVSTGAFAVVEERIRQPNGEVTVLHTVATVFDTLPPPIRNSSNWTVSPQPARLNSEPSANERPGDFPPAGSTMVTGFYIIAISPNSPTHKPGPR